MFFFFQAEEGIRDIGVTGVQTCALPISTEHGLVPGCGSIVTAIAAASGTMPIVIGRASCRERVYISVVAVSLKKKRYSRIIVVNNAARNRRFRTSITNA